MKSLIIASAAVGAVYADTAKIFSSLNQMMDNASNFDRTISHADAGMLDMYGCWCYFEEDHRSGRGKAIDELDQQCKILHDGYQCAIMDASMVGQECVPWAVAYNSADGLGLGINTVEDLRAECLVQNSGDSCENWACNVEGFFVMEVFRMFVNGVLIDTNLQHSNGFDPMTECPVNVGIASERACCGDQPLRFPYKTYNDRECCIDRTFDSSIYSCCVDGSISMTCA